MQEFMKVYKFGGAAAATPLLMTKIAPIIKDGNADVIVLSAIAKNTNALEEVVREAVQGNREKAEQLVKEIEIWHHNFARELLNDALYEYTLNHLNEYFTELHWALDDAQVQADDYVYDQIVCIGELVSSTILYAYLKQEGQKVEWIDIRDVIKTDESYRHAEVNNELTDELIKKHILPIIQQGRRVVTQGFIGSSTDNNSTTLGREGSDYTASILAAALDAESVIIWKDVPGFLNADPKYFNPTVKLEKISFYEVIELAFYGAQIIHPKTIKPMQNKNIPLYVKSFLNPEEPGTVIQNMDEIINYPCMRVLKHNQTMIQLTTQDFSFIDEGDLKVVYELCSTLHLKINLLQHTAISLVICVSHEDYKLTPFLEELQEKYIIRRNENLKLLTIRHYNEKELKDFYSHHTVLLEQRTRHTVQLLY